MSETNPTGTGKSLDAHYMAEIAADVKKAESADELNEILDRSEIITRGRIDAAMHIIDSLEWPMDGRLSDIYNSFVFSSPDGVLVIWSDYTLKFEVLAMENRINY
jgi:hypothetical protein